MEEYINEIREFLYQGRRFTFAELIDPLYKTHWDVIAIFEIKQNSEDDIIFYEFVNYFYGAAFCENREDIIDKAKSYIDEYIEREVR